jgi:hypothetical protein
MALDKCRNVTIELELRDRASSLPPAVVSGGTGPDCSGCARLPGTQAECRNRRDGSACGARGVLLIRVEQTAELTRRVGFVTRCVSFGEAVTPTLALPRSAGEGTGDLPPLSAFSAGGGGSGWGSGGRIADQGKGLFRTAAPLSPP